jgi:multisubunit Na+/H+ antiporter MnhB subunit
MAAYAVAVVLSLVLVIKLSVESPVLEGITFLVLTVTALCVALIALWDARHGLHAVPAGLYGSDFFAKDWDDEFDSLVQ